MMSYADSGPTLFVALALGVIVCPPRNCTVAQTASPADRGIKLDDVTPEAAICTFYNALARGDARSASRLLVTPAEMAEWTEIQANMSVSFQRLGAAAVSQFGDDGKLLQVSVPAETVLRKLDTIKPIQDGDTAEWRINPKVPMKMKRVHGHWKLDLYSSFRTPAHLRQINAVHRRVAAYVGRIATDIADGKFESVADVREEFKRQREAMNKDFAK